jgi:hypothetical protein
VLERARFDRIVYHMMQIILRIFSKMLDDQMSGRVNFSLVGWFVVCDKSESLALPGDAALTGATWLSE